MINTDTNNDLKGSINNTATQSACVDFEEIFGKRTACIGCNSYQIFIAVSFSLYHSSYSHGQFYIVLQSTVLQYSKNKSI